LRIKKCSLYGNGTDAPCSINLRRKVIKNKKTGVADLKDKAKAWERITKKYCSQGFTPRTSKQLKKCWDNMK